jgi:hypothetical protein
MKVCGPDLDGLRVANPGGLRVANPGGQRVARCPDNRINIKV